jgi:hypothetical protein
MKVLTSWDIQALRDNEESKGGRWFASRPEKEMWLFQREIYPTNAMSTFYFIASYLDYDGSNRVRVLRVYKYDKAEGSIATASNLFSTCRVARITAATCVRQIATAMGFDEEFRKNSFVEYARDMIGAIGERNNFEGFVGTRAYVEKRKIVPAWRPF